MTRTHPTSAKEVTALLVIDPRNDFISDAGGLWTFAKETADGVRRLSNMIRMLEASGAGV